MDLENIPTPEMSQRSEDSSIEKVQQERKPSKVTRKQRIANYIYRLKDDNIEQVMEDILKENQRLKRELETLRVAQATQKREYDELMHALLQDRLKNQHCDLDF